MSNYISNPLDSDEITKARKTFEKKYGLVYDTTELKQSFEVIAFSAPYISVIKKATKEKGTLEFNHSPRFYFNFVKD